MRISGNDFSYLTPEALSGTKGIDAWFTLKNGHYSSRGGRIEGLNLGFNTTDHDTAVTQNRSLLLSDLDVDSEWIAYADQVHSDNIQVVSEGGTYSSTDGLITTMPGLTLAIQVADCAAVLLWDASSYVVGAFHAGWRGAAAGILSKGVRSMVREGADPGRMEAFVSPCLSQKNFEVGTEVAELFPSSFVDTTSYRKPHVDLKGYLAAQLRDAGLIASNLEVRGECTLDEGGDFYSYRREGGDSGRMMALIRLNR
ncbi:conserved hypothetical protein [Fodinibius roseus]|uniref:Purine nucleoside phosphorylase n=1 Tax=Fodinibius roseus TaxID=1194090 RepID=A0A1M4SWX1_9BACT|nr:peptidoglycan editing factor PgeF [Fodinibius roseus]SHE36721.1 conserved hypothetical protein [Fodinibius roseus]